jgi:cadmium resistance protein CadD (predicted permease)
VNSLPAVILASVATFTLTNIDDLMLLTFFFARRVPMKTIVAGQYLGFSGIVALGLAGSWAAMSIPSAWFRLLGVLPLAVGVKQLLGMHRVHWKSDTGSVGWFSIALVTLANGGDNIGVYLPFFAIHHTRIGTILLVYAALLMLWCAAGRWLGNHPFVLRSIDRYGHFIVPLVFMGLGIYILAKG